MSNERHASQRQKHCKVGILRRLTPED
ncbi:MAG: hypothetical protein RLZZ524_3037, partial [Pseudomonadota bacterium]